MDPNVSAALIAAVSSLVCALVSALIVASKTTEQW